LNSDGQDVPLFIPMDLNSDAPNRRRQIEQLDADCASGANLGRRYRFTDLIGGRNKEQTPHKIFITEDARTPCDVIPSPLLASDVKATGAKSEPNFKGGFTRDDIATLMQERGFGTDFDGPFMCVNGAAFVFSYATQNNKRLPNALKVKEVQRNRAWETDITSLGMFAITVTRFQSSSQQAASKSATAYCDITHADGTISKNVAIGSRDWRDVDFLASTFSGDGLDLRKYGTDDFQLLISALTVRGKTLHIEEQLTLGWTPRQDDIVWLSADCVEAIDATLTHADAFIYPPALSKRDTLRLATKALPDPDEAIVSKMLRELAPEASHVIACLVGSAFRVMTPVAWSDRGHGAAPFAIDVVGRSGIGKTPVVNGVRRLWGSGFSYDAAQDIGINNSTSKGEHLILATSPYAMLSGFDVKKSDINRNPAKLKARAEIAKAYFDDGEAVYSSRTQKVQFRGSVTGLLVNTAERDLSLAQLRQGETGDVDRTLTLEFGGVGTSCDENLTCNPISDVVSRELNKPVNRQIIASFGREYRRWIMRHHADGSLTGLVQDCDDEADDIAKATGFETDASKHQKNAAYVASGLILMRRFMQEAYPAWGVASWPDEAINAAMGYCKARSDYLRSFATDTIEQEIDDGIQSAMQQALRGGQCHFALRDIATAELRTVLQSRGRGLNDIGWRDTTGGRSMPSGAGVGVIMRRGASFVAILNDDAINGELRTALSRSVDFSKGGVPSGDDIKRRISASEYCIRGADGKLPKVMRDGKRERCIVLDIDYLAPDTGIAAFAQEMHANDAGEPDANGTGSGVGNGAGHNGTGLDTGSGVGNGTGLGVANGAGHNGTGLGTAPGVANGTGSGVANGAGHTGTGLGTAPGVANGAGHNGTGLGTAPGVAPLADASNPFASGRNGKLADKPKLRRETSL
jgi:hypothetical protein